MTPRQRADLAFSEHAFAWSEGDRSHHVDIIESAIAGAVAAEREACAMIAETVDGDWERDTPGRTESTTRKGIAAAIRSRT